MLLNVLMAWRLSFLSTQVSKYIINFEMEYCCLKAGLEKYFLFWNPLSEFRMYLRELEEILGVFSPNLNSADRIILFLLKWAMNFLMEKLLLLVSPR